MRLYEVMLAVVALEKIGRGFTISGSRGGQGRQDHEDGGELHVDHWMVVLGF